MGTMEDKREQTHFGMNYYNGPARFVWTPACKITTGWVRSDIDTVSCPICLQWIKNNLKYDTEKGV